MLLLLAALAQASDCAEGVTTSDVYADIERATALFLELRIEEFASTMASLEATLPCVVEPIPQHLVAKLHRMIGLGRMAMDDRDHALLAFAAARRVEPNALLPEELVPPGSPVYRAYREASGVAEELVDVPAPEVGHVEFDAVPGLQRPLSWPAVFQRFDLAGGVLESAYLWPSEAVPDYAVASGVGPAALAVTAPRHRTPLLASTIGVAALGGALYGGALASRASYRRTSTPDGRLDGLRTRTNSLATASVVSVTAALGLGAAVVVTW